MPLGPVQLLVIGFDHPDSRGDAVAELDRLRTSDIVRLIDLLLVHKDAGGLVRRLPGSDPEAGAVVAALIGLDAPGDAGDGHAPGGEDLWSLDDAIRHDSTAVVALIEHRWATGVRDAIRAAGGVPIADAWVHPADLAAAGLTGAEGAGPADG